MVLVHVFDHTSQELLEKQIFFTDFFVQEHIFLLFFESRFLGGYLVSKPLSLSDWHAILASSCKFSLNFSDLLVAHIEVDVISLTFAATTLGLGQFWFKGLLNNYLGLLSLDFFGFLFGPPLVSWRTKEGITVLVRRLICQHILISKLGYLVVRDGGKTLLINQWQVTVLLAFQKIGSVWLLQKSAIFIGKT